MIIIIAPRSAPELSITQTVSVGEDMPLVVITKKNAIKTVILGDFHRCQTLTTP